MLALCVCSTAASTGNGINAISEQLPPQHVPTAGRALKQTRNTGKSFARSKKRHPMQNWFTAVEAHLSTNGAARLSPATEAYATMWYGDTKGRSFDGLKTLIHSIRSVDKHRDIVIMTPVSPQTVQDAEERHELLTLQGAFSRVVLERVPLQTIFNNTTKVCQSAARCGGQGHGRSYLFTYSKFGLWSLTKWTRLMYIDLDVLVTAPLEDLWNTRIGTKGALVAASYAIRARTFRGIPEKACSVQRRKSVGFNTGLVLLQPSKILHDAINREMRGWRMSFKSPCRSDQTYFNILFDASNPQTRCLPYSANCRDPQFLNESNPPNLTAGVSLLSRCLEPYQEELPVYDPSNSTPMVMPFTVHFACNSKPWLPENRHLFFARKWLQQLELANALTAHAGSARLLGEISEASLAPAHRTRQVQLHDGHHSQQTPRKCSLVPGQVKTPLEKTHSRTLWRRVLDELLLPGRRAATWNNYYDDLATLLQWKMNAQHDWHRSSPMGSMRVAEIGTMYGGASERIMQRLPATIEHFVVDPFLSGYDSGDITSNHLIDMIRRKNVTQHQFSKAWALGMAHDFHEHFGCRYHLLHTKSVDAAPRFLNNSLDVVFIDGLHTYDGALEDIRAWWPKLNNNGGLMILNDYGTRAFPGVKAAVRNFMTPRGLKAKVGTHGVPPGHRNAYVVRWPDTSS